MLSKGISIKATAKISLFEKMVYDESGNTVVSQGTPFGTIASGEQIGIIEALFAEQNFAYVQLFKPVSVNFKKHYYALIFTDNVAELPQRTAVAGLTKYYAKCQPESVVNVRLSGSLAGTIKTKLKNGSLIGESDGKANTNGFIKFNLALGGVGYVHKDYATTSPKSPALDKVTEKVSVINPQTGATETKERTTISTAEGWTLQDIVIKSVIGAVVAWGITKVLGKIFKF